MNTKKFLKEKNSTLNIDQRSLFNEMQSNSRLQVCVPTGVGKGYLMIVDLLNRLLNSQEKVFVISSHRLMLNTQHLNDIFIELGPFLGQFGFIFVGSSKYDVDKFQYVPEFNQKLQQSKLNYHDIVSSTTSKKEVGELVDNHLKNDRKVIVLTTYHSLHTLSSLEIDTIYNDEAHTLASDEISQFQKNFEVISANNYFFLTATPKDCHGEETDFFLMNNEDIFGKRVGLSFKECVDRGYIVRPTVHIALPSDFSPEYDYSSVPNMSKFILDTFEAHKKFIQEHSIKSELIGVKILVKCPSVDDMWKIHQLLMTQTDILVAAGASKNEGSNFNHFIGEEGIKDRSKYLEKLQELKSDEEAIVLHYDTMSEGINVSGFTGVEFLGGKLPTITKVLQNTGRATRLHKEDRDRLRVGEINTTNLGDWVKPYCSVIIPYWDRETELSKKELASQIKNLRDQFGFDPVYYVSVGTDIGKGKKEEQLDPLNDRDRKDKKFKVIEEIQHEIEILEQEELDQKEIDRIQKLSMLDWVKENSK
jgi:superfamily II DNA or RNA helicase